ncbi:sialidase (plasmid) [Haloarcula marismortui ATCC 43049]|uniref:Sialidase n=1 Tax=Haloarcula marismortui (strain ATCC 43049 / DSM 3752 / JCM 8966 / VKM B-1809) TaxID=272569 RepID=Q5V6G4_HALMA|nr:COG1361 S-layer family protein [Haloarcula marismortui]AAV44888.1 sialidase [Haloarcula marismortui ATCC 43049]QCP90193.1 sialidase [Haloarcula marismortui ATCC 43049]
MAPKAQKLLLLAVVGIVVTSGTATAAVVGSPDIVATLEDDGVAPGEQKTVEISLVNTGDLQSGSAQNPALNSEVTAAKGLTVSLSSGDAPISVKNSKRSLGTLQVGPKVTVPFEISVDEDADSGTHEAQLKLRYKHASFISEETGARDENENTRTVDVEIDVTNDATFNVTDIDSNARVDSTGTVAVTVENTGSSSARDSAVTLESQSQDLTVSGGAATSRFVDKWEPGEVRTFNYRVSAAEAAEPEPYGFELSVAFDNEDGLRTQSAGQSIAVEPDPEQRFSVVNSSSSVAVSNTGTYEVQLRNTGPLTVDDASVTFASRNADITFGKSSSTTAYVGNWEPGEVRTVRVDATASPDAEDRSYALSANVQYDDHEGDTSTYDDVQLSLSPAPEQNFGVSNIDTSLQAGEDGSLSATLTNTGTRDVENVVIAWESQQSTLSPKETQYAVGNLDAGESANFSFGVDVSNSAEAGARQFDFGVSYRDDNDDRVVAETLEVRSTVDGSQDEFDIEMQNSTLGVGQDRSITFTITNTKDKTLTSIEGKAFVNDPLSSSDDETFIAELGPRESETVSVQLSAGSNALDKTYPLNLDFQYETPDGDKRVSDTYSLPIEVTDQSGSGGTPLWLIGGVGLLAVVGGVVWYSRQ